MARVYLSIKIRRTVRERARDCCEYCRCQMAFSSDPFSVEHIVPLVRGGSNELDNLAFSCQGCNSAKHTTVEAEDPITETLAVLFHPRQDRWHEHFTWNESFTKMIGLTPTGRATVIRLDLNRTGVMNIRWLTRRAGLHPPTFVSPTNVLITGENE